MANDNDYGYRRGRYGRGDYDDPYYRGQGDYEEPYYEGYGGEPSRHSYGRGSRYGELYGGRRRSEYYREPYAAYDYGRYQYGGPAREPYYRRGYEGMRHEPYYHEQNRGLEGRSFFDRAGDVVRSWFDDEEAERRRREDDMRRGAYAGRGPRGYRRSDERIREDVNDCLTDDWRLDASDIEVTVNDGVVTLTGRVDGREEKRRAADIAECVSGVTDVSNQLRVGRSVPVETEEGTAGETRARTART